MRLLGALLCTVLMIGVATAAPVPPPRSIAQDQYGGTRASESVFPMTFTEAGATKTVRRVLSATVYSDYPELFEHGAQIEASCSDSSASSAHRTGALFCWVQTDSATITPGNKINAYSNLLGGEYDWGGTLGWINDDTEGSPCSGCVTNQDGMGACFRVLSGSKVFNRLEDKFFRVAASRLRPAGRNGSCGSGTFYGWPCDADADCPGSETCAAGTLPRGAFLAAVPTSTTVTCTVEAAW